MNETPKNEDVHAKRLAMPMVLGSKEDAGETLYEIHDGNAKFSRWVPGVGVDCLEGLVRRDGRWVRES